VQKSAFFCGFSVFFCGFSQLPYANGASLKIPVLWFFVGKKHPANNPLVLYI
jgi:hypothetical protein